jgi:hypothetical protein
MTKEAEEIVKSVSIARRDAGKPYLAQCDGAFFNKVFETDIHDPEKRYEYDLVNFTYKEIY